MTRSAYGRDFLNYGSLPTFKYTPQHNQIFPSFSRPKQQTSYDTEFTAKNSKKIDFKELDCFKDKFKYKFMISCRNLKISFMQEKSKDTISSGYTYSIPKTSRENMNSGALSHSLHSKFKNLASKTESSGNYLGSPAVIPSKIKDSNLNKMKYSFKAMIRA